MRKRYIPFLILCMALLLCACGREKDLGEWTVPQIESRPTAVPTAAPDYSQAGQPEKFVWNELAGFDMSSPGVAGEPETRKLSHAQCLSLFGGQFLPKTIFNESYGSYERMYLEQKQHDVLVDADGALAGNAYVEFRYLNKAWVEAGSITVMAELCDYDRVMEIYTTGSYPHIFCADGSRPALSKSYLNSFVLGKQGDTRYAQ